MISLDVLVFCLQVKDGGLKGIYCVQCLLSENSVVHQQTAFLCKTRKAAVTIFEQYILYVNA